MVDRRISKGIVGKLDWKTGQDVFDWWIGCGERFKPQKGDMALFDIMEEEE